MDGPLSCNATFQCIHDVLMFTSVTKKQVKWIAVMNQYDFGGGELFASKAAQGHVTIGLKS